MKVYQKFPFMKNVMLGQMTIHSQSTGGTHWIEDSSRRTHEYMHAVIEAIQQDYKTLENKLT